MDVKDFSRHYLRLAMGARDGLDGAEALLQLGDAFPILTRLHVALPSDLNCTY